MLFRSRTMDDLVLAVVRGINERRLKRFEEALTSTRPLQALWELNTDRSNATLSAELTSIATHREPIRAEIVQSAKQFRALQVEGVTRLLAPHNEDQYPAAGIVMIAVALARTMVTESALGLTDGHQEALAIVDRLIQNAGKPGRNRNS